ncbi:molybdopterin-dependent oxidoreductase [Serratia aquatilis]|uniref:Molybdopterin-dependent oxidoreductase n=1 Tax=Serratia aquatilis TaxID=1737515 RepID=A0ABV6EI90_9GAMM
MMRNIAFALLAVVIAQSSALSFTLQLSGNIKNTTDSANKTYVFTDKDIFAMPVHSITTSTSWTPREKFDGVLLADILAKAGANGTTMTLYALNDYYIEVPISDVAKYNMILAYKMGGNLLKVRDFGPLFLIYPRDAGGAELNSPLYNSRFIWQINRIVIK